MRALIYYRMVISNTCMVLIMPVLPPSMNDWGDHLTYVLLPRHIPIACDLIDQVITCHLPFTMQNVTIKPSSNEELRSINELTHLASWD